MWYNIGMDSLKVLYNNHSTTKSNAFFIETQPILTNANVTSNRGNGTGGWGSTWNFSAVATDEDNDTMTVKLYVRKKPFGSWTFKGQNTTVKGINQTVLFSINTLELGDKNDIGDWEYRFNVTEDNEWSDQTSEKNFTVEKDAISVEQFAGNNAILNRDRKSVV